MVAPAKEHGDAASKDIEPRLLLFDHQHTPHLKPSTFPEEGIEGVLVSYKCGGYDGFSLVVGGRCSEEEGGLTTVAPANGDGYGYSQASSSSCSTRRHRHQRTPSPLPPRKRHRHGSEEDEREKEKQRAAVSDFIDGIAKEQLDKKPEADNVESNVGDGGAGGGTDEDEIEMMKKLGIPLGFDSS
ncbi:hypothetical protein Tsubulata_018047 [Turnera subulata]|uniref:Uncharacterized protein n=1 Tax=Turnera subulata TaxID=218843 RepID=A0A9Q0FCB6_9ROSI|nr:hypothetical protein Tsubulata_018047 [Turnera subulata]